ncbi:MAG: branched-chain amino acid ABC transporter permease [Gammaproteobacteria bacterium]|nr:MAG: branched-chain amino acid ABC transporter permease [Gammaproteobacteria bacterium]
MLFFSFYFILFICISLAVIPWGILCGSLAIEAGLSAWQAQLMSLLIFAGAAQLSGVNLIGTGTTLSGLLNSTLMISSRHLLYSAAFEKDIRHLSLPKRILFAFLLTDEMFAVVTAYQEKYGKFIYRYAIISGAVFYAVWNVATLIGIISAKSIGHIDELGLDFAIAAIFIAMTVPRIKGFSLLMAAGISGILAVWFELTQFKHGLMVAGLIGMAVGYFLTEKGLTWKK